MLHLPRRLSRYIALETLIGLAGAVMVIGAVILLVDFVEQSRAIGTRVESISALDLLMLTFLKAPLLLEETLPFVFLFGVLATLFRLNRRSELIVMRASGYSAWRILSAPIVIALLTGILGATALNPIGAAMNAEFERRQEALTSIRTDVEAEDPVWLRETTPEGFTVIAARALDENARRIRNPSFFFYTLTEGGAPAFERRIDSSHADLNAGFWVLEDAVERAPGQDATDLGAISIQTFIDRQALFERSRSPRGVAFWDLPGLIRSARAAGLDANRYELRLHSLLALPLTLIAATLIAAAATLRLYRLGGAGAFALAGGISGFVVYFFQELLRSFGATGTLPPITAAWAAPAITALVAAIYIASTEDG
ncbi:LptF/LptG family permease [Hyphobacterium marinum]|uniref:LptF/LptG family permease n=1 Tax=Hyphobacterium marinum TaxID=3116574 RepID=A0ABU7M048_9PROT|nr:LptF/LptG family permease [Hyphobacterium sp. Y6023]MEE2567192.1 LptF/LptG family permease [Hyphobacterium sp. Y6023]